MTEETNKPVIGNLTAELEYYEQYGDDEDLENMHETDADTPDRVITLYENLQKTIESHEMGLTLGNFKDFSNFVNNLF